MARATTQFDQWARRAGSALLAGLLAVSAPAAAQEADPWDTGIQLRGAFPAPIDDAQQPATREMLDVPPATTVVPRTDVIKPPDSNAPVPVNLVALLTADGQRIEQGVVWRIYKIGPGYGAEANLILTKREASPSIELKPGVYIVNAAFGQADLTRKITVAAGTPLSERFVLNAGGLRVKVLVDGKAPPPNAAAYDIYAGERDQFDNRTKVMNRAKPNLVIRLNAGIYHIVSTYGDANATVESDVTVEAGKLTEATVSHAAARVTFKLVTRIGGEALPDTQWTVQTPEGQVVKQSVGALPTHILAPGAYTIIAKSGTNAYKRDFSLANGEVSQVEVLMQ
jgi:hypothetical protein